MKIFLKLLGLAFLALLAVIIVVPFIFDPNDFKDDIETLVKDKTGRQLNIEDPMEISLFPWIGVEIGRASLGNAKGFGAAHFVKIESAKIKVKFWPLFSKELEVNTITLYGLDLNLQTIKTGASHWDDLTDAGAAETTPQTPPKSLSKTSKTKTTESTATDIPT